MTRGLAGRATPPTGTSRGPCLEHPCGPLLVVVVRVTGHLIIQVTTHPSLAPVPEVPEAGTPPSQPECPLALPKAPPRPHPKF